MKRSIGILFVLISIIIFSTIPGNAQENSPKIIVKSVKQGKNEIVPENGVYNIRDYKSIVVNLELDDFYDKKVYYINGESGIVNSSSGLFFQNEEIKLFIEGFNKLEDFDYSIKVYDYDAFTEEGVSYQAYDEKILHFSFDLYEANHDVKAYLTKVMQNEQEIIPDTTLSTDYARYEYDNTIQVITYSIRGENFQSDGKYRIGFGNAINAYSPNTCYVEVTGSQLNNGYSFDVYPTVCGFSGIEGIGRGQIFNIDLLYRDNDKDYRISGIGNDNSNIEDYTFDVMYKNHQDKEIEKLEDDGCYLVSTKYYDENNPLSIKVKGNGHFEDKDYEILIEGKRKDEVVFNKIVTSNGANINNGYVVDLDDYELSYVKDIIQFDDSIENYLNITINGVRKEKILFYYSTNAVPVIYSSIFYEDGKKNLSTFRGDGFINWNSGYADTNSGAFNKYHYIYLNFRGEKFLDNEEYDYILKYGYVDEDDYVYEYPVELDSGKIKGKVLNNIGMNFRVDNRNNYDMPTYRFIVKKGDEFLFASSPALDLMDVPVLANVSLSAKNKNLYLQIDDGNYIATRNAHITTVVSGLGYDDNKMYPFNYCYSLEHDNPDNNTPDVCSRIELDGKKLNTGKAKIEFKDKIPSDVIRVSFSIDNYFENDPQGYLVQGYYGVNLVDSKDLFPEITQYILDNNNDLIKNISKNTSVSDFAKKVSVANNGSLKVFDNTGNSEITESVGTGMILRVLNEYGKNVLDIDVVVKGDVTGDGSISITDLVKEKQEIAGLDVLDGLYELAGDITGSNSIGPTDLVKMARDIAGIEEIE